MAERGSGMWASARRVVNSGDRSTSCDCVFIGGGFRATTFLASAPELLERDIVVIEERETLGPGSFQDYATMSSSVGAAFFRYVRPGGVFAAALADPRVEAIASAKGPVDLLALGRALQHLGHTVETTLGRARVLRPAHVTAIHASSRGAFPFLVRLRDGRDLRARVCVLATGRCERLAPFLQPWRGKTWLSSEAISQRMAGRRANALQNAGGQSVVVLGGSHSAFSALGALLRTCNTLCSADPAYEPPQIVVAHRSAPRLCYSTVAEALDRQIGARERLFDATKDVCPATGIVFRDSGLRAAARDLYCAIWTGAVPHVQLRRISSLAAARSEIADAAFVVQALGFQGRVPRLTVDGHEVWDGSSAPSMTTMADGRVTLRRPDASEPLPLFAIRVEPTPLARRDHGAYASDLYARLADTLLGMTKIDGRNGSAKGTRASPEDAPRGLTRPEFSRNTAPTHAAMASGSGATVVDVHGRKYIDCCAQTLNANLGQCHPAVTEAAIDQLRRLTCVSSRFASDVSVELHRRLIEITPGHLSKVNLASVTGSAANECAIKAARKRTGREVVVSLRDSHHGQTVEMMRISGKHWDVDYLGERRTRFIAPPNCERCPYGKARESCDVECLSPLEDLAAAEGLAIAAVIVEPIMVDAGVLTPPRKYHARLRALCDAHDFALIYDEIQTAFGWLGVMTAMELYGITPDIVTFGKGLGAGFPLAATIMSSEYDVLTYGEHEMTSGAFPASCAASLAMLSYLGEADCFESIRRKGLYARERLERLADRYEVVGSIRGCGLLLGFEICHGDSGVLHPDGAARILADLLHAGIIMRIGNVGGSSSVLQFKPPLVITHDELAAVFDKLDGVLSAAG